MTVSLTTDAQVIPVRPDTTPAVSQPQRTLAGPATVAGIGYVTGSSVSATIRPAAPNTGFVFRRVDLVGSPEIPARAPQVIRERRRRTALQNGPATIEMTEHVLAALAGLGVDNAVIDVDGGELPGLDGSCQDFVNAIEAVGTTAQPVSRIPFVVHEPLVVVDGDARIALLPSGTTGLQITYTLDYGDQGPISTQSVHAKIEPSIFRSVIAPARTFVMYREVKQLLDQGLGPNATTRDLLVLDDHGVPIDNTFRFVDECARHKILDVVGDLALLGRPIQGHVVAYRSGHHHNVALVEKILESECVERERALLESRPLLDAAQIEQIIPHRFPFMLVDRVLELVPNQRVVGIKNVSYNEPYFAGHWPGRPVMPGVLIIEAMAQLAGIMLTQWQEHGQYAMIVGLDNIRLRRRVVPGDQLWMEAEAVRVKAKTAQIHAKASVNRELAAEADLRFMLMEEPPADL